MLKDYSSKLETVLYKCQLFLFFCILEILIFFMINPLLIIILIFMFLFIYNLENLLLLKLFLLCIILIKIIVICTLQPSIFLLFMIISLYNQIKLCQIMI